MSDVLEHIDAALDRILRKQEQLLADPTARNRAARLAELYDAEARAWAHLFELSTDRMIWRAALVAQLVARRNATAWSHHAGAARRALVGV